MKQKLSEKEKEILSEIPEEAIKRILYWEDFKPVFRAVKLKSVPNQAPDSDTKSSDDCNK